MFGKHARMLLCLGCFVFFLTNSVYARKVQHDFGLGVLLGEPTGITAKTWLTERNRALDFGLAYSFDDFLLIHSDYLFHFPEAFGKKSAFVSQLSPYIGAGGVFVISTQDPRPNRKFLKDSSSTVGVGMRVPLGISWFPEKFPLEVFVELVPGIAIVPTTNAFLQGGLGARYYF